MGSPPPPYLPHGKAGGDHKMKYKIKKLLKKTYNMYREFVFFGVSGCVWPNLFWGKLPRWEQGPTSHKSHQLLNFSSIGFICAHILTYGYWRTLKMVIVSSNNVSWMHPTR
jgi:hypothetical protein